MYHTCNVMCFRNPDLQYTLQSKELENNIPKESVLSIKYFNIKTKLKLN